MSRLYVPDVCQTTVRGSPMTLARAAAAVRSLPSVNYVTVDRIAKLVGVTCDIAERARNQAERDGWAGIALHISDARDVLVTTLRVIRAYLDHDTVDSEHIAGAYQDADGHVFDYYPDQHAYYRYGEVIAEEDIGAPIL